MTQKMILNFPAGISGTPITYELIRVHDVKVNILKAEIQPGQIGSLLVELEGDQEKLEKAKQFLINNGVRVSPVSSKVSYDEKRCINCGNCVSACFSGALTIGAPDWKLHFNPEKCIACKLCLTACPQKLFRIEFSTIN